WYWSPGEAGGAPAVQFAGIDVVTGVKEPGLISLTHDGETFMHFTACDVETLEEREYQGITYAHKVRVTDRNEHGELDVVITRDGGANQGVLNDPGRPTVFFRTG